jgi:hypothetical protein
MVIQYNRPVAVSEVRYPRDNRSSRATNLRIANKSPLPIEPKYKLQSNLTPYLAKMPKLNNNINNNSNN